MSFADPISIEINNDTCKLYFLFFPHWMNIHTGCFIDKNTALFLKEKIPKRRD